MLDGTEAVRKAVLHLARFSGLATLLSSRMAGIGAILMLHKVTAAPGTTLGANSHLSIAPAFLDAVLSEMTRLGYDFVPMDALPAILRAGSATRRVAAITADDGYRDNLLEALPVLERHGAPITVYVSPSLTDRATALWWDVLEEVVAASDEISLLQQGRRLTLDCSTSADKRAAYRRAHDHLATGVGEGERQAILGDLAAAAGIDPMAQSRKYLMDWNELGALAAHPLATIGAHTVHHHNLKRLDADRAREEMVESRRVIEMRTGVRPVHFAYPYGHAGAVGEREVGLAAAAGFETAVTTRHGVLLPDHARYLHALPRISVNGRYQHVGHLRTMLSGVTTPLANAGRRLVTV